MESAPLWIGLDIGGSGARALPIEESGDGWEVCGESHELDWEDGFRPVPLREQLAYLGEVVAQEEVCGGERVMRLAELVSELADGRDFRLGVCAPGLRTDDGRGVLVWRNGPRRTTLLGDLERSLSAQGAALAEPLTTLSPDALACALGEVHARDGALRGCRGALSVAGGSGVGEAVIVEGRCFSLDELEPALPRAWELSGGEGLSLEDCVAPGRVYEAWAEAGHEGAPERDDGEAAAALLGAQDEALATLIARAKSWFDDHGHDLERVALCQALGRLFAEAPSRLEALRERCGLSELVASELRSAPAIGAVVCAAEHKP